MPKQTRPQNQTKSPWPNEAGSKAPAEGAREVGGGAANRPAGKERANEERVPPRGDDEDDGHA